MIHWARDHHCCVGCGTIDRSHHAKGLCTACYYRQYDRKKPARRARGNIEEERQKVYKAIVQLHADLRIPCPIRYRDGRLTLSVGKTSRSIDI